MELEINQRAIKAQPAFEIGSRLLMVTPPINENYWLMRVKVSDNQAIVCFPKFGTIGVGFQKEEDWNTNLPHTETAEGIFRHISHNKGDDSIPDADCIGAIKLIQEAILKLKEAA